MAPAGRDDVLDVSLGLPGTLEPGVQVPARGQATSRLAVWKAVFRRLGFMALVLLLLSIGIFALTYLAPGSPEQSLTAGRPVTAEALQALRERYHLDDPLPVQYGSWAVQALALDFGESFRSNESVSTLILRASGLTLQLVAYAFVIVLTVSIPLALLAATRQRTLIDRGISAAAVMGIATPPFVVSVFLLYVCGVRLGWFPIFGPGEGVADRIYHLTLPALALSSAMIALILKITRASLIDVFDQEYIIFARARGLPPRKILLTYGLRNGLGSVATAAGLTLASLLASTALVEESFAIPGLGALLVDAVKEQDLPVVQGVALTLAASILLVTFITDIVYVLLDPRLEFEDSLS